MALTNTIDAGPFRFRGRVAIPLELGRPILYRANVLLSALVATQPSLFSASFEGNIAPTLSSLIDIVVVVAVE